MADMIQIAAVMTDGISGPAGKATGALGVLESAAGRGVGVFTNLTVAAGKAALAVGAISFTAVSAGMASAVSVASSYEQQLSAIAAVSSKAEVTAVGGMKAIGDAALQLGKDTSFSATEAAAGMEEMVKAGVSLKDVMAGGGKAALDLAAAGALSVAEAATVASNAMNAFGLAGSDFPHIADALAGASVASATDVHQLGYALASVGAVAHGIGLSFDDTTTAISLLAQAGLKGSDSGTSLKSMLNQLSPQTKKAKEEMQALGIITRDGANQFFTANGAVKDAAGIAEVLQKATANLTKEQKTNALVTLFGTDGQRAALILSEQGAAGINKMADAQRAAGGAAAIANERLNNLRGSLEKLGGTWEVIRIKFGSPFLPVLKRGVDQLTETLNNAEPAITAFAERTAAGLDTLVTRAQAAVPAFMAAGMSLFAFGKQGLDIARSALPLLADGFERLKGVFTADALSGAAGSAQSLAGGLAGAFKTLAPLAVTIGRAVVGNITETFKFLTTRVLPPLVSILTQTGAVVERTLLPAFLATGGVMRGIFGDSLDWLAKTVWPPFLSMVEQTSALFTGTILPTLPGIATALRTTLGETVQWLADDVWPKLTTAAGAAWTFISGTIAPALPGIAATIRDALGGALEWIGTTGWPLLVTGATAAWTFLNEKVIPVVTDLVGWLREKLPPAIETVTTTFEALRTKLSPIVEAVFRGDIATALKGLGTAFSEFGSLAAGWLTDQVATINWTSVWSATKDVLGSAASWFLDAGTKFAGWIGDQVAQIPWTDVWNKAVSVFDTAVMWFGDAAPKLAGWIGEKVAQIPWGDVWNKAVDVVGGMATWFVGIAGQFGTWIADQVAQIKWDAVWNRVTDAIGPMVTWFADVSARFTTWMGEQVGKIDWDAVWKQSKMTAASVVAGIGASAQGLDNALTQWVNDQVAAINWQDVGLNFGRSLVGASQTGLDEAGNQVTALDTTGLASAFGSLLIGVINGAWQQTLDNWRTLKPGETYAAVFVEGVDKGGIVPAMDNVWKMSIASQVKFAADFLAGIGKWATDTWTAIDKWATDVTPVVEGWEGRTLASFGTFITDAAKTLSEGWDGIWKRAGEAWDSIWGLINQKGGDIVGALTNQVSEWIAAGKAMGEGLVKAVGEALASLVSTVTGPVQSAIDAVRRMLPGGAGVGSKPTQVPSTTGPLQATSGSVMSSTEDYGPIDNSSRASFARTAWPYALRAAGGDRQLAERMIASAISENGTVGSGGDIGVGYNFGGIKYDPEASGSGTYATWESEGGQRVNQNAGFAHYNNVQEGFDAIPRFLQTNFPRQWAEYQRTGDSKALYQQINAGGYATDQSWHSTIENIRSNQVSPVTSNLTTNAPRTNLSSSVPGTSAGKPLYVLPVPGMGSAALHWGKAEGIGGTDIMAPEGTPVSSIGAGTVMSTGTTGPGGNNVLIQGADGKQYYYAHLKDAPNVVAGQTVDAGTSLGAVGSTGNAAGGPSHLHLGIGDEILNGTGPTGGTGSNFNAVSFLNDIAGGKYAGPLQQTADGISRVNDTASDAPPALEATATGIETVGAASEKTGPSINDVGQHMFNLGETAPAAAQTAAEGVIAQFDLMKAGSLLSVTDMGSGVLTTAQDMAGNTVATVTDMAGNVTSQSATLANGVSLNLADMAVKSTTSVDEMSGNITRIMTDAAGNSVTTVTNASGQIVSQYATMNSSAGSSVAALATTTKAKTGEIASSMSSTEAPVKSLYSTITNTPTPNYDKAIGAVKKLGDAFEETAKFAKKLEDAMGSDAFKDGSDKGGSQGGSKGLGKGKAAGGRVYPGMVYPVGEEGIEFFAPDTSGVIIPNHMLTSGGRGSYVYSGGNDGGGGTLVIQVGNIIVPGMTDAKAAAEEIRAELINLARSNGGAEYLFGAGT